MPDSFKEFTGHVAPLDESCAAQLQTVHPLKTSELSYEQRRQNLNLQMLRNREGLAAPLKLTMELKSMARVGHLPFLPSTNVGRDVLTGRDELIDFTDIFNLEENTEFLRQPHAVMEKIFGIH
ncbi:proteasome maturation protein isoform X2 [Topomyia yanbarensis]|nr:proteasome maturation protein isoform X2 [Topomyia yanbarensis]